MKVSVLMSVYAKERAEYLRQSLDSIFCQTLPADEVVLVCDGLLTPELELVIGSYENKPLRVVKYVQNRGLGLALRDGMAQCRGELIARMDTDDIALPDRLATEKAFLEAHPETDIVGGWVTEFTGSTDHVISVRRVPESHDDILRFSRRRNPMNHPTVMMRKEAVERAGGYQDCPLFEDYDLWARMFLAGARFHNLQQPLLYFRMSAQLFSRRGGLDYIGKEINFQCRLHHYGHIGWLRMATNIVQRTLIRLFPNEIRKKTYLFLLRR